MKNLLSGLAPVAVLLLLTVVSCKKDEGSNPAGNCRISTLTDSIFGGTGAATYDAQGHITQLVYRLPGFGELERRTYSYTGTQVEEKVYLEGAPNPADTWHYALGTNGYASSKVYGPDGSLANRDSVLYAYDAQGYLTGLVQWRRNSGTGGSLQKLADLRLVVENGNTKAIINNANQDTIYAYSFEPGYPNQLQPERVFTSFGQFMLQSPGFQPEGINFLTGKPNRNLFTSVRTKDNNRLRFLKAKINSDQLLVSVSAEWTTPTFVSTHRLTLGYDCP